MAFVFSRPSQFYMFIFFFTDYLYRKQNRKNYKGSIQVANRRPFKALRPRTIAS